MINETFLKYWDNETAAPVLLNGADKNDILEYAGRFYNLDFELRDIRPHYSFDVLCEGSVPVAIKSFIEGNDFADVIATAISVGGDSDTIAAIAGSIAEVVYPIPEQIRKRAEDMLDEYLMETISYAQKFISDDYINRMQKE